MKVSGVAATLTQSAFIPVVSAPSYGLAGQISTGAAAPIGLTLHSATFTAAGSLSAKIWADQVLPAVPLWKNVGQTDYCGLAFYMSNGTVAGQNFIQNKMLQCIGVMKPVISSTATISTPSNEIEINMTTSDLDISSRKLWVVVGNKVRISAYLVTSSGQLAFIGDVLVTIT
jgi:hypothetical protein